MKNNFTKPELKLNAFTCPYCLTYSRHEWSDLYNAHNCFENLDLTIATCDKCEQFSIWKGGKMIYPKSSSIPYPNEDLSVNVKKIYLEARDIFNDSPIASCALLRLSIQEICKELGEKGQNLNTDIGQLVAKGLPIDIQKALDIVRVIGNNAVHPGLISIEDNIDVAQSLFYLINFIAEKMITEPKKIRDLYSKLPESKLEEIEKRDLKNQN